MFFRAFDGVHFDGDASKMNVFERWNVYQQDPTFRQMLPRDLIDYAVQIVSALPGWRAAHMCACCRNDNYSESAYPIVTFIRRLYLRCIYVPYQAIFLHLSQSMCI